MSALDRETLRLIVQAGVAAVNHGMTGEARQILDALPLLMQEGSDRDQLAALIWLGLGEAEKSWSLVENDASPDGALLRGLIARATKAGRAGEPVTFAAVPALHPRPDIGNGFKA